MVDKLFTISTTASTSQGGPIYEDHLYASSEELLVPRPMELCGHWKRVSYEFFYGK